MFFNSFVASKARKVSSEKRGGAEDRLPIRCRQNLHSRAIWKSKSWKTDGVGALFEVEIRKICTRPARKSDLESKIIKNWHARNTFWIWASQNTTPAPESDLREEKGTEHFWKLSSAELAPRCGARAIWKSKPLKHHVLGTFLEIQNAFRVAGAGILARCKIRGRHKSLRGLQKWVWRVSEMALFAWQAQRFRAL